MYIDDIPTISAVPIVAHINLHDSPFPNSPIITLLVTIIDAKESKVAGKRISRRFLIIALNYLVNRSRL
jgi:hypothetical protein